MAPTTRLRLRVAPGASRAPGIGSRDKIVELAGIEPDEIDRRLAIAGGQETG